MGGIVAVVRRRAAQEDRAHDHRHDRDGDHGLAPSVGRVEPLVHQCHPQDARDDRFGHLERGKRGAQITRLEGALHDQEAGGDDQAQSVGLPVRQQAEPVVRNLVGEGLHQRRAHTEGHAGSGGECRRAVGPGHPLADEDADRDQTRHQREGQGPSPQAPLVDATAGSGNDEEDQQRGHEHERPTDVLAGQPVGPDQHAEYEGEQQAGDQQGLDEHQAAHPDASTWSANPLRSTAMPTHQMGWRARCRAGRDPQGRLGRGSRRLALLDDVGARVAERGAESDQCHTQEVADHALQPATIASGPPGVPGAGRDHGGEGPRDDASECARPLSSWSSVPVRRRPRRRRPSWRRPGPSPTGRGDGRGSDSARTNHATRARSAEPSGRVRPNTSSSTAGSNASSLIPR